MCVIQKWKGIGVSELSKTLPALPLKRWNATSCILLEHIALGSRAKSKRQRQPPIAMTHSTTCRELSLPVPKTPEATATENAHCSKQPQRLSAVLAANLRATNGGWGGGMVQLPWNTKDVAHPVRMMGRTSTTLPERTLASGLSSTAHGCDSGVKIASALWEPTTLQNNNK